MEIKIKLNNTVSRSVVRYATKLKISPTQLVHKALTEMGVINTPTDAIDAKEGIDETQTNNKKDKYR